MIELRKAPRINVTWRTGIKLKDGSLMFCRAVNISKTGLLLDCPQRLMRNQTYHAMIEIPSIEIRSEIIRVSCQCEIKHIVLTDDHYRVGIALDGLSDLHQELINAWVSKANQKATVE
ncbi:PilZ domain-containing protein [Undibacterium jejuense]|uniref:PilZ domain-containing protein n=1 Tax=Undibacterium jejuense TaxID=1344949 RepID=A0A923HDQ9_9BURK|nr:PilZ domain-containing protein [Undibacterium jejuense]MBC3861879.1 PilZ domain-containing protein [Undibacterium jejuense]